MAKLILTPGDPTGIGPEIAVKALSRFESILPDARVAVVGSVEALARAARQLGVALPESDRISYRAVEAEQPGLIAYRAVEIAGEMMASGEADALVTGPISKKNLREAGFNFPGHTEILEDLAHRIFNEPGARAEMLFQCGNLRLLLLTRHIPLKDVSAHLAQKGAVAGPLKTLIRYLRERCRVPEPRIAMLGLNPHAGETGGDEEKKYLLPVINAVNAIGNTRLDGPFAADGFFRSLDPEDIAHDAIVACYHDQGLIPFKMIAGYEAVNVTIGLPFLRTSVGHGTAEDIAGKGIAREDSLIAALRVAVESL